MEIDVPAGKFTLPLQTVFGSVPLQERRDVTTREGEIRSGVFSANSTRIVVEHDVQNPVHRFHAPVTAHTRAKLTYLRFTIEQDVACIHATLATLLDLGDRLSDAFRASPENGPRSKFRR